MPDSRRDNLSPKLAAVHSHYVKNTLPHPSPPPLEKGNLSSNTPKNKMDLAKYLEIMKITKTIAKTASLMKELINYDDLQTH